MPPAKKSPENLKERLHWMIEYLDTPQDILVGIGKYRLEGITDLIGTNRKEGALPFVMGLEAPSDTQFYAILAGNRPMPQGFVKAIQEIFPAASIEMITTPKYSDFEELKQTVEKHVQPWIEATAQVATKRGPLAKAAMSYYQDITEPPEDLPDFPLVTKKDWIADNPILLTETMRLSTFQDSEEDVRGQPLWSGGPTYRPLKLLSLSLRGPDRGAVEIKNGLTFRLQNFGMKAGLPSFQFSKGEYFNYVDTLESLAAEFALFQARRDARHLDRRGPPQDIFRFRRRSAFVGVNCLLIIKNFLGGLKPSGSATKFAIHERTRNTIEGQDTIHVIPAGGPASTSNLRRDVFPFDLAHSGSRVLGRTLQQRASLQDQ